MSTTLVVDDRSLNRKFLAILLGYTGHTVLQAEDGSGALATVRRCRPDLIITDLRMPVKDGLELTKHLHADLDAADIPMAFYSAGYWNSRRRRPMSRAMWLRRDMNVTVAIAFLKSPMAPEKSIIMASCSANLAHANGLELQMRRFTYTLARDPRAAGGDIRSVATDSVIAFATALVGYERFSYKELSESHTPFSTF